MSKELSGEKVFITYLKNTHYKLSFDTLLVGITR